MAKNLDKFSKELALKFNSLEPDKGMCTAKEAYEFVRKLDTALKDIKYDNFLNFILDEPLKKEFKKYRKGGNYISKATAKIIKSN